MVVYLDLVFLVNCLTDLAALWGTARLSGIPVRPRCMALSALLGGLYGVACLFSQRLVGGSVCRILAACGIVWLAMGKKLFSGRLVILFSILSCALSGALMGTAAMLESSAGKVLASVNWKVFLLAGVSCFGMLTVLFRNAAAHGLHGQLRSFSLVRQGRSVSLTALIDTGHTLTDVCTGTSVLIAEPEALLPLWSETERRILSRFGQDANRDLLRELPPGSFFLLPYRAMGISEGTLLCFRAEGGIAGERRTVTAALSPVPLSGNGYSALWGGSEEEGYDAA